MERIYILLGKRIRDIRRKKLITQAEICECLEISRPSLCNIENGRHRLKLHVVYQIAEVLDVPVTELIV